jgi:DNA-binding NtrC family response regulator
MNRKILCVDDEENVLRAFERNLRLHFEIETAVVPVAGLSAIAARGPYAVVISDLRMPEMDGIQFLATVRKQSPDTVRLILSGNADLQAAIAAEDPPASSASASAWTLFKSSPWSQATHRPTTERPRGSCFISRRILA